MAGFRLPAPPGARPGLAPRDTERPGHHLVFRFCDKTQKITAEGDLGFRGTLAVSKDAPVGFTSIRLTFDLDTEATAGQIQTLIGLTKRYCVVFQTLAHPARLSISTTP